MKSLEEIIQRIIPNINSGTLQRPKTVQPELSDVHNKTPVTRSVDTHFQNTGTLNFTEKNQQLCA